MSKLLNTNQGEIQTHSLPNHGEKERVRLQAEEEDADVRSHRTAPRKKISGKGKTNASQANQNQDEEVPLASLRTSNRRYAPTPATKSRDAPAVTEVIQIPAIDKQLTIDKRTLFDKFLKTDAPIFRETGGDREAGCVVWIKFSLDLMDRMNKELAWLYISYKVLRKIGGILLNVNMREGSKNSLGQNSRSSSTMSTSVPKGGLGGA